MIKSFKDFVYASSDPNCFLLVLCRWALSEGNIVMANRISSCHKVAKKSPYHYHSVANESVRFADQI